ncbi:MAG: type I 3-dehydroquinate dehydratase [Candidatus Hadarchaeales archaeon]
MRGEGESMGEIFVGKHKVKTPAVCASIAGREESEMERKIKLAGEADLVEVRMDLAGKKLDLSRIMPCGIPLILTNRPRKEGGGYEGGEKERVGALLESMDLRPSCVDVELSTPPDLMREVLDEARRKKISVLISHHEFSGTPKPEFLEDILKKATDKGNFVKIVTMAKTREDATRMLEFLVRTQERSEVPLISFAMGEAGKITRYIAPVLGSPWMYAGVLEKTAPGQPDLKTAVEWIHYLRELEVRE